ncbi:mechanosensitive ion channel family protein [Pseudomonas fluorescens]|nr:mechanosensitive ion channel family protein [Pseudomonas fluorescens]MBD8092543.1 mechanosensitive ion channel family protein [Pseudomonas fluorescens]MBD8718511.1 mechanosensitive ion channel family protein [Pseudomonas fluorescens]
MPNEQHFLPLVLINFLGLAGIIVWHIQGRRRPTARLFIQILFFVVMTVVLVLTGITPYRLDGTELQGAGALLARSARVLWWTHLAWTIIGFVQIYMTFNRRPREARLLQDLIVGVVYLGVALAIFGFVFSAPIGTLVATSGVVAVIIGLALQNTLGDVFSGVALTFGRVYSIGDWIQLSDGTEGRVVETNWRSTKLLSGTYNVIVLPNSVLAKLCVTNLSHPDETQQVALTVRISSVHTPSIVESAMLTILLGSTRIIKAASSTVVVKAMDAAAIELELRFHVASPAARVAARNEVFDLVYRYCEANGLPLAMPPESLICGRPR